MRVHCCLFDVECWADYKRYGMPIRLHVGEKYWNIPILAKGQRNALKKYGTLQNPLRLKDATQMRKLFGMFIGFLGMFSLDPRQLKKT